MFTSRTRSGCDYSAYLPADLKVAPIHTKVDFSPLLAAAIDAETHSSLQDDDAEPLDDPEDDIHVLPTTSVDTAETAHAEIRPDAQPVGKNSHRHAKRKRAREQAALESGPILPKKARSKIASMVQQVQVDWSADDIPATKNAYTAKRAELPDSRVPYTAARLDAMGFQRIRYIAR